MTFKGGGGTGDVGEWYLVVRLGKARGKALEAVHSLTVGKRMEKKGSKGRIRARKTLEKGLSST